MDITKLIDHLPGGVYYYLSNNVAADYNINNELKLAHFLAQCSYESKGFSKVEENLNYSAARLLVVFPTHFDEDSAAEYAGKPEQIANHVYANRFGNGPEGSGDGWNFRGRGYIQLTFKPTYGDYGNFKGIDLISSPDLVASDYPLDSAAWFFESRGLFDVAEAGDGFDVVTKITRKVNGSDSTAADRYNLFLQYYGLVTQ